jgi:hypothetical protein
MACVLYSELAGQNILVVTLGAILPSGTLTRKKRKAEEWLSENGATKLQEGEYKGAWVLPVGCRSLSRYANKKGNFDVEEFLWHLDIRRVYDDDPYFWPVSSFDRDGRRQGRERKKALRQLGHDDVI